MPLQDKEFLAQVAGAPWLGVSRQEGYSGPKPGTHHSVEATQQPCSSYSCVNSCGVGYTAVTS